MIAKIQAAGFLGDKIIKLNADERTAELKKQFPDKPEHELNLQAAKETDAALEKSIGEDKPCIFVETVLSSTKYQDDVLEAKGRGYKIGLVFVSVYPPKLILDRIEDRVAEGGHNVDAQKALDRYKRSHVNLVWFGQQADKLFVYDNSGEQTEAVLVAAKEVGKKLLHKVEGCNPSLDKAIRSLQKIRPYNPKPSP